MRNFSGKAPSLFKKNGLKCEGEENASWFAISSTVKSECCSSCAAIKQDVKVPYSCRNGTCRTCLYEVKEGTIQPVDAEFCMISEQEPAANRRLLCMSLCRSDAVIEKVLPKKRAVGSDLT